MKKVISTDLAPKAIGPYSQGIMIEDFLFVSGQVPIDPKTGEVVKGDITDQAHQSMKNVKSILESQGMTLDNVVKTTVFITNMDEFSKVNDVYGEYFNGSYPARSCIQIGRLPKDALIEVEVIAHK